jgi:hypothetical protein
VDGVVADSLAEFCAGFEQAAVTNNSSKQGIVIRADRVIVLGVTLIVNPVAAHQRAAFSWHGAKRSA